MRFERLIACLAVVVIAVPVAAASPLRRAPDTYGLAKDEPSLHTVPFSTALSRRATSQVELYFSRTIGEIARVVFFIPSGYRADLSLSPGGQVGTIVTWGEGWGHIGRITAGTPSEHVANSCSPGLHEAVWLLEVDAGEEQRLVPMFVDRTIVLVTALGAYKLEACLEPAAELGMRIAMLELDFDELTNPPVAGGYTWRAFVTPYGSDGQDTRRTFELRSTVPLPMKLTLHGRFDPTAKRAVLSGRFLSPAFDVSDMPVELYVKVGRYLEPVTWTRTHAHGSYSFRRKLRGKATFAAATGAIVDCGASRAAAGCVSETIAGVASAEVTVAPRRR